MTTYIVNVHVC